MNKYNNPRLLNTVVSGTGMLHPTQPHVVLGKVEHGFMLGDLMDANGVMEAIKDSATNIDGQVQHVKEEIMNEILDSLVTEDNSEISSAIMAIIDDKLTEALEKIMNNPATPAIDSIQEIVEAIDAKRDTQGNWFTVANLDQLVLNVN